MLRFGGVSSEVLLDNAKPLVEYYDAATRGVRFNAWLSCLIEPGGTTKPSSSLFAIAVNLPPPRSTVMTWDAAAGPPGPWKVK